MPRLTFAVLSLAFLAACQPATTEFTEDQKAEIEQEVRSLDDNLIAFASKAEAAQRLDSSNAVRHTWDEGKQFPIVTQLQGQTACSAPRHLAVSAPGREETLSTCQPCHSWIVAIAIPAGVSPTGIVRVTVFERVSITATPASRAVA